MSWTIYFKIPDWQVVTAAADASEMSLKDYVYQAILEKASADVISMGLTVVTANKLPEIVED